MTDLISTLADALVALNNASPRLPRKDQIEDVLRKAIPEIQHPVMVAWDWGSQPSETVYVKWSQQNDATNWEPISRDEFAQAIGELICPANPSGEHDWHDRYTFEPSRCLCGAIKP